MRAEHAREGATKNRYAYANNNPVKYRDPRGYAVETAWDALNVGMGLASMVENLSAGKYGAAALDALGVVVDVAAVAAPFVPGGIGAAIKFGRAGDKAVDAMKAADAATTAAKAVDKTADAAIAGTKAGKAADQGKEAAQTGSAQASGAVRGVARIAKHHARTPVVVGEHLERASERGLTWDQAKDLTAAGVGARRLLGKLKPMQDFWGKR